MTAFLHPHQRPIRSRLRQWQQVRTWARLIREAEALWHVDVRALRRMGADELIQLIEGGSRSPPQTGEPLVALLCRGNTAHRRIHRRAHCLGHL